MCEVVGLVFFSLKREIKVTLCGSFAIAVVSSAGLVQVNDPQAQCRQWGYTRGGLTETTCSFCPNQDAGRKPRTWTPLF